MASIERRNVVIQLTYCRTFACPKTQFLVSVLSTCLNYMLPLKKKKITAVLAKFMTKYIMNRQVETVLYSPEFFSYIFSYRYFSFVCAGKKDFSMLGSQPLDSGGRSPIFNRSSFLGLELKVRELMTPSATQIMGLRRTFPFTI